MPLDFLGWLFLMFCFVHLSISRHSGAWHMGAHVGCLFYVWVGEWMEGWMGG